jgi:signal transduction histidine kinase
MENHAEHCYALLFEKLPDGILILDQDWRIVDANPAACGLLGCSHEAIVHQDIHLFSAPLFQPLFDAIMEGDQPEGICVLGTSQEFEYTTIIDDISGLRIAIVRGVNAQNSTEKALGEGEKKLGALQKNLPEKDARYARLTTLYAVLSRVNESIVRIRDPHALFLEVCHIVADGGFPLVWIGEVRGQQVVPLVWWGPAADYLQTIRVEVQGPLGQGPTGTSIRENRTVINDDFAYNPATISWRDPALQHGFRGSAAIPLHFQGNVIAALTLYSLEPKAFDAQQVALLEALAADLSYALEAISLDQARRSAEESILKLNQDLTRQAEQLQLVNKELESFSYSISHDLRAPLRAVSGFSNILRTEYGPSLDPEMQHYLEMIDISAQKMGHLIEDLLKFSRLSRQELTARPVDLNALVREVVGELALEMQNRQVELRIDDLPPCQADPALLKQVLINLLSNALKYSRRRPQAIIQIGCQDLDGGRVYFVKDNGVGFNMRYVDKIFMVFQRLHSADEYEGTGVGLAIVQRIIQRHGGRVWAEAEVDKGATFYFTLPGK